MLPCVGFGWGDYQLTTYPVDLLSHLECPGFKIQVIPLKGADLTPAQACGQFRQEQFIAAPLWPGSVTADFLRYQDLHFSGLGRGKLATSRRISEDQVFLHSFVQSSVESRVDAANGLI